MMYQQVPALFYSLTPKFDTRESIRLTSSQFDQLNGLISDYCYTHDVPRLKGLLKRIRRRMEQHADHHLWHTEFDYIAKHLVQAMKDSGYCRLDDDSKSIVGVLNRHNAESSKRRRSRDSDHMMFSQSVKQLFDKWLH